MQLNEDEDEDSDNGRKDVWGASQGRPGHLKEVSASGFVGLVDVERVTWAPVHLYDTVGPFLVVFADFLTKFASHWNATLLLITRFIHSLTSIPTPSFSECSWVGFHEETSSTYVLVITGTT
jgi:hypothetical protein